MSECENVSTTNATGLWHTSLCSRSSFAAAAAARILKWFIDVKIMKSVCCAKKPELYPHSDTPALNFNCDSGSVFCFCSFVRWLILCDTLPFQLIASKWLVSSFSLSRTHSPSLALNVACFPFLIRYLDFAICIVQNHVKKKKTNQEQK